MRIFGEYVTSYTFRDVIRACGDYNTFFDKCLLFNDNKSSSYNSERTYSSHLLKACSVYAMFADIINDIANRKRFKWYF